MQSELAANEKPEIVSLAEGIEGKRDATFDEKEGIGHFTITGDNGELLYERGYKVKDPSQPKGEREYDYENTYAYNEKGKRIGQIGQNLDRDNRWEMAFGLDEEGNPSTEDGEITSGEDLGHKWSKVFRAKTLGDGTKVEAEFGKIVAQGDNPKKEFNDHQWKKLTVTTPDGKTIHGGFRITEGGPKKPVGPWDDWGEVSKYESAVA